MDEELLDEIREYLTTLPIEGPGELPELPDTTEHSSSEVGRETPTRELKGPSGDEGGRDSQPQSKTPPSQDDPPAPVTPPEVIPFPDLPHKSPRQDAEQPHPIQPPQEYRDPSLPVEAPQVRDEVPVPLEPPEIMSEPVLAMPDVPMVEDPKLELSGTQDEPLGRFTDEPSGAAEFIELDLTPSDETVTTTSDDMDYHLFMLGNKDK